MAEPTPLLSAVKPAQVEPRVWREGAFVADFWHVADDDGPVTEGRSAIVSLARWRSSKRILAAHTPAIGVRLAAAETLDPDGDDVHLLGVVVLPFPKFSDGRSYSAARRLREAGFTAEIRATGDVLLDQIPLMLRAGFDAFEITDRATVRALEASGVPAIARVYQAGAEVSSAARFARRGALG